MKFSHSILDPNKMLITLVSFFSMLSLVNFSNELIDLNQFKPKRIKEQKRKILAQDGKKQRKLYENTTKNFKKGAFLYKMDTKG